MVINFHRFYLSARAKLQRLLSCCGLAQILEYPGRVGYNNWCTIKDARVPREPSACDPSELSTDGEFNHYSYFTTLINAPTNFESTKEPRKRAFVLLTFHVLVLHSLKLLDYIALTTLLMAWRFISSSGVKNEEQVPGSRGLARKLRRSVQFARGHL